MNPPLPEHISGIADVIRLHGWIKLANALRAEISKDEADKLFVLVPRARVILKRLDAELLLGGAGCVARQNMERIFPFFEENDKQLGIVNLSDDIPV